jgi:glycopeptide antibiotics resistance protein
VRPAVAALAVYLVVLLALTFLPLNGAFRESVVDIHLVPFKSIGLALRRGPGTQEFAVLIGNILAFVPLGVLVPIVLRRRSWLLVLGLALGLSVAIELGQLTISVLLDPGYRTTDIDDVIVNVFGAAVGYAAYLVAAALVERAKPASG